MVFVYAPLRDSGFVRIDDPHYVSDNAMVQRGLTLDGLRWAFSTIHASNWHPLTWISHMLDAELYGMAPLGHHASSVALHLANALLLWLAFTRLTGKPWRSWFVALLFAVHPLHVESVAWISERKDVLSALFFALVLLAYERFARAPSARRMVLVALLFALGLLCKPMLVTAPFVLLVLDAWPLGRGLAWAHVVEKWLLFVLAGASSIVTFVVQRDWGSVVSVEAWPLWRRAVDAVLAYAAYLRLTLVPIDLAVHYPHVIDVRWGGFAVASGLLAAITIVAVREGSRRTYLLAGWLWFLGMLVPVIGLVQVGTQAMADRYTYLPLLGPFVALVWLAAEVFGRLRAHRAVVIAASTVVIAPLVFLAQRQVGVWHDSLSLFEHAVRAQPTSATAHQSLGDELAERGQLDAGIAELRIAIELSPDFEVAHNGLGVALDARGEKAAGLAEVRRATTIAPRFFEAWFNLGVLLFENDDMEGAAAAFERAVALRSWRYDARVNLAATLARLGQLGSAREHCRVAAQIAPDVAADHRRLAEIAEFVGDPALALVEYQAVLRLDPLERAACERALALATEAGEEARAAEFSRQLERIRAGAAQNPHR